MEKLILTCGRYATPQVGNTEARVAAMEAYLSRLTEEMEFLISELGRAQAASATVTAATAAEDGEVV